MIFSKINLKKVTGYKVVKKVGNHLYSFATGMEYKIGLIEPPTQYGEHRDKHWGDVCHFNDFSGTKYSQYEGYTAVFLKLEEAETFLKRISLLHSSRRDSFVIVKMTLKKVDQASSIDTDQCYFPIVLGKEIVSMEIVKTK